MQYSVLLQGGWCAACRCLVRAKYHISSKLGVCEGAHQKQKIEGRRVQGCDGGVECGKCERTQACNILYFCKKAGVQHVDAVIERYNTISVSWGCVNLLTKSKKWRDAEFKGVMGV